MKLILFGGVKGVGKTTLRSWLKTQFGNQIELLDAGELFRQYFYNEKLKTTDEIEEIIVSKLESAPSDSTVVVHWHYSVLLPSGYSPQVNFSRLRRLAKNGKINRITLLVVEAPIDVLRNRRLKDSPIKKRELGEQAIAKEVEIDEEFLSKHFELFSEILGSQKVSIFRLVNTDLTTTQSVLYDFFRKLLGLV